MAAPLAIGVVDYVGYHYAAFELELSLIATAIFFITVFQST
jgi:hypothetical protein